MTGLIKVKDLEIPIQIKSYKTSKSVKIYFKGNQLTITKPRRLSSKTLMNIIKENEAQLYKKYKKILGAEINTIKQWKTGEKIHYQGEEFTIIRENNTKKLINIEIEKEENQIIIKAPEDVEQQILKKSIDNAIKKIFKRNTEMLIYDKLPYWSKITKIEYNQVKVRDATTRYGSCMPSKKNLYFSSRLIMLPEEQVDAVIVHELCHIKFKNHDKNFYNLVSEFIPNYKELDKWLKKNGNIIMF